MKFGTARDGHRRPLPLWLEALWIILTGPLVVFVVAGELFELLPGPLSIPVAVSAVCSAIGVAWYWERHPPKRMGTPPDS